MPYLKYLENFQVKVFGLFKALGSCPEAIGHILIYITSGPLVAVRKFPPLSHIYRVRRSKGAEKYSDWCIFRFLCVPKNRVPFMNV